MSGNAFNTILSLFKPPKHYRLRSRWHPRERDLKALDFSLDKDWTPDEDNMYTHAPFKRENFPFFPSFTLCTAFRVDAWTEYMSVKLIVLRDNTRGAWTGLVSLLRHLTKNFPFFKILQYFWASVKSCPTQRIRHLLSEAGSWRWAVGWKRSEGEEKTR